MSVWQAVLMPAATPRPLREALQAAIAAALAEPALRGRFAELGADRVLGLGVAESEGYVALFRQVKSAQEAIQASQAKESRTRTS